MSFNWNRFVRIGWALSSVLLFPIGLIAYLSWSSPSLGLLMVAFLIWALFSLSRLLLFGREGIHQFIQSLFPKGISRSMEFWAVSSLFFIILSGTFLQVPVFKALSRVNTPMAMSQLSDSTTISSTGIPNLEKQTIWSLSIRFEDSNPSELFGKLSERGIVFADSSQTLAQLADANQTTVEGIFRILAQGEKQRDLPSLKKPAGERTLEEVSKELKISLDQTVGLLREKGIKADRPTITLKELGEANGFRPVQIYRILSSGGKLDSNLSKENGFDPGFLETVANWTLQDFSAYVSKQQGKEIPAAELAGRFERDGIVIPNYMTTFSEIARMNQIPLEKLMRMMGSPRGQANTQAGQAQGSNRPETGGQARSRQKNLPMLQQKGKKGNQGQMTDEERQQRAREAMQMTLEQIASRFKIDPAQYVKLLKDKGIQATPQQTIAQIAQNSGKKPREIFLILKGDK